jgi:uncharacterized DUF497 family protein
MRYEYDPNKSQGNKVKHGIDFEEAQALWNDAFAIEQAARSATESRYMVVGRINDKMWSAFVIYRDAAVRIISVRRSRGQEIEDYEKELARRRA